MSPLTPHTATAGSALEFLRARLTGLLDEDDLDQVLATLIEELDDAGITVQPADAVTELLARNRVYRSALRQLGHAIEVALADPTDDHLWP